VNAACVRVTALTVKSVDGLSSVSVYRYRRGFIDFFEVEAHGPNAGSGRMTIEASQPLVSALREAFTTLDVDNGGKR
jgi:hypothetical protein